MGWTLGMRGYSVGLGGASCGTGWDIPYSPMCVMVQWDGMDTRD